jgi:hypothetical protein
MAHPPRLAPVADHGAPNPHWQAEDFLPTPAFLDPDVEATTVVKVRSALAGAMAAMATATTLAGVAAPRCCLCSPLSASASAPPPPSSSPPCTLMISCRVGRDCDGGWDAEWWGYLGRCGSGQSAARCHLTSFVPVSHFGPSPCAPGRAVHHRHGQQVWHRSHLLYAILEAVADRVPHPLVPNGAPTTPLIFT